MKVFSDQLTAIQEQKIVFLKLKFFLKKSYNKKMMLYKRFWCFVLSKSKLYNENVYLSFQCEIPTLLVSRDPS